MAQAYISDLVDLEVVIIHRTERGVLVNDGRDDDIWLPLSHVELSANGDGKTYQLTLPERLAIEKGLV